MATQLIPRVEWRGFFNRFSGDHEGEHAILELLSPELGDQTIARRQVFRGISADEKAGENAIAVMLGGTPDESTTHAIAAPTEVWLRDAEGAVGAAVEIRNYEGSKYLIRFLPPTLPAMTGPGA